MTSCVELLLRDVTLVGALVAAKDKTRLRYKKTLMKIAKMINKRLIRLIRKVVLRKLMKMTM